MQSVSDGFVDWRMPFPSIAPRPVAPTGTARPRRSLAARDELSYFPPWKKSERVDEGRRYPGPNGWFIPERSQRSTRVLKSWLISPVILLFNYREIARTGRYQINPAEFLPNVKGVPPRVLSINFGVPPTLRSQPMLMTGIINATNYKFRCQL